MEEESKPSVEEVGSDSNDAVLDPLPKTYGELQSFLTKKGKFNLYEFRLASIAQIQFETKRPLLCYATQTSNVPDGAPVAIDDGDLIGFSDLIDSVSGNQADVFLISNGGSAEASERIVRRLRGRFEKLRFLIPSNAYSAATLMCLSGDEILMLPEGTLGPIDPQINGVPARAIIRGFERLEARLAEEGPRALTAYVPMLQKYDLHLLEQCRSAEELSRELAHEWLTQHAMDDVKADTIDKAVDFFCNWDLHKSHGRSIDATAAIKIGVPATVLKDRLADLVRSLYHQYTLLFEKTAFYKVFENSEGIAWGRQHSSQVIDIPIPIPEQSPPNH